MHTQSSQGYLQTITNYQQLHPTLVFYSVQNSDMQLISLQECIVCILHSSRGWQHRLCTCRYNVMRVLLRRKFSTQLNLPKTKKNPLHKNSTRGDESPTIITHNWSSMLLNLCTHEWNYTQQTITDQGGAPPATGFFKPK